MPYKDKKKQRSYLSAILRKRRAQWFLKNGPCQKCGSDNNLELDHVDPATKVSHRLFNWSKARRDKELRKCQALCRSCHKEKSRKEAELTRRVQVHGTVHSYGVWKCRCKECVAAANLYHRDRKRVYRSMV